MEPIKLQANGLPEELPKKPVTFAGGENELPFLPATLNNKYIAVYTIESGDTKHTLKEKILVKWLATDDNGYSFFEIDKLSNVYIDDTETDLIVDRLAEKTAAVFYPLIVVVNQKGKWVDIHNFESIKERWENTKKEILEEYEGEVIEESLAIYESQLTNKSAIVKALSSDWFLRAFFNGINTQYKKEFVFENEVYFPISKKTSDAKFTVTQQIEPYLDSYNLINITQTGTLTDTRTKEDFEGDTDFPYDTLEIEDPENAVGTYNSTYFLNPNNYCVESLFLECSIALNTTQKVTVTISNLNDNEEIRQHSKVSLFESEIEKKESLFKGVLRLLRG
jgi:hypothetical protein